LEVGGSSSTSSSQLFVFGLATGGSALGGATAFGGSTLAFTGSFLAGAAFFFASNPRSSESLSLPPKRSCLSFSFEEIDGLAGAVLNELAGSFVYSDPAGFFLKSKSNPPSSSSSSSSTAKMSFFFFLGFSDGLPVGLLPDTESAP
jgi:hypothetical protein